jgi:hypothetical protein
MEYKLTKKNLSDLCLPYTEIEQVEEGFYIIKDKFIFFTNMKIYTEQDALKKHYFNPNSDLNFPHLDFSLVEDFYNLGLKKYVEHNKSITNGLYDINILTNEFIQGQKVWALNFDLYADMYYDKVLIDADYFQSKYKNESFSIFKEQFKRYANWLDNKINITDLKSIFKSESDYDFCKELMIKFEITDENMVYKHGKHMGELSALISCIHIYRSHLLKIEISLNKLLSVFNYQLNTDFQDVATKSKAYKDTRKRIDPIFLNRIHKS